MKIELLKRKPRYTKNCKIFTLNYEGYLDIEIPQSTGRITITNPFPYQYARVRLL